MNREELAPHIEEIKKALGNKIGEEIIAKELDEYVNIFHIPLENAKRSVLMKHGNDNMGFVTGANVVKKIGNLTGNEQSVDIIAKVVFSTKKTIPGKNGERTIISGILGDETATASFTEWSGNKELVKGNVYRFKNCYTKTWNDTVQLNIGNNGSIEETDIVIENVPTKQRPATPSSELKISEIREGSGNVTVVGRIISVSKREIQTKSGETRTVYSGMMCDDTGEIQYSAWNDFGLQAEKSYRISNAYIRSWKGIPQLNLGDNTEVSEVDIAFDTSKIGQGSERTIGDIVKNGGGLDVIVRGVIVDIRPGSGIIKRCPECNRTIINNDCKTHGTVEPIPDLRMRIVIDDGTGSIATTMNREATERFTGVTFDAAFNLSKARGEDIVVKDLGDRLYMKHLKVRGAAMIDEYGAKINAKEITFDDVDVNKGAKELLDEVERML
jgi:replication factor A1